MSFLKVKRNAKGLGLSLAVAAAAMSVCQSSYAVDYQFGGAVDNTFLTSGNWTVTPGQTPSLGVPSAGDRAFINAVNTVSYATAVTTSVDGLSIGADWPVTGDLGTAGTLNMTTGKILVAGGGNSFQIGRAAFAGDGAMNMSGNSILEIFGSDPIVGTRDNGVLDLSGSAQVIPSVGRECYWRLGNYGPTIDAGLEGNGLLSVRDDASFRAHVLFIGATDSTGEVRVSGNGAVILTGNIVPRPDGGPNQFTAGSATVRMSGSAATFSAYNLESESQAGEIPTHFRFDADAGGVSEIKLVDAINIGNNTLEVNLAGYVIPPAGSVVLFDGDQALAGSRIFGSFASLTVDGILNPAGYSVVYDQPNGNILLQAVPEPTMLTGLAALGMFMVRRRRA